MENCIPLCFDCHADMLAYDDNHPKGTKYRPDELRRHRDAWIQKVSSSTPSTYNDDSRKLDRKLFKNILAVLPWTGSMEFINQNNFAGFSFDTNALNDLTHFLARNEANPEWEFIDPTLEVIRATQ